MDRQPTLEGELLWLRPMTPEDFEPLRAIAADPLLWEQHPAKERAERAGFEKWFEDATASGGTLVAIDRSDGRIIGTSRFDSHDPERGQVEIGWTFVARSHWGRGYNDEMKRLMLDHAFQFVDTVAFRVHEHNMRSQRAVEKLGSVAADTETDRHGRGQNIVFRLDRETHEAR